MMATTTRMNDITNNVNRPCRGDFNNFSVKMKERFLKARGDETKNYIDTVLASKRKQGNFIYEFPIVALKNTLKKEDAVRLNIIRPTLLNLMNMGFFKYYYTHGKKKFKPYMKNFLLNGIITNPWDNKLVRILSKTEKACVKRIGNIFEQDRIFYRVTKQGLFDVGEVRLADLKVSTTTIGSMALAYFASDFVSTSCAIALGVFAYTACNGIKSYVNAKVSKAVDATSKIVAFVDDIVDTARETIDSYKGITRTLAVMTGVFVTAYILYRLICKEIIDKTMLALWVHHHYDAVIPEGNVTKQAAGSTVPILILFLIGLAFGLGVERMARNYGSCKVIVKDVSEIFEPDNVKQLFNWLAETMGYSDVFEPAPSVRATRDLKVIEDWLDQADLPTKISTDQKVWEQLESYERELPNIKNIISVGWTRIEEMRYNVIRNRIASYWAKYRTAEPAAIIRIPPVNIFLSGPSNTGKTTVAKVLAGAVDQVVNGGEGKIKDIMHTTTAGNFPWEAYEPNKHHTIFIDDFMQKRDANANGLELEEWYKIMEDTPYICDTAFEDKGKKRYKARANIFTTNNGKLDNAGVITTEAFFKRLHLNLRVTRDRNEKDIAKANKFEELAAPEYKLQFPRKNAKGVSVTRKDITMKEVVDKVKELLNHRAKEKDVAKDILERVTKQAQMKTSVNIQFKNVKGEDGIYMYYPIDPGAYGVANALKHSKGQGSTDPYDIKRAEILLKVYTPQELRNEQLGVKMLKTRNLDVKLPEFREIHFARTEGYVKTLRALEPISQGYVIDLLDLKWDEDKYYMENNFCLLPAFYADYCSLEMVTYIKPGCPRARREHDRDVFWMKVGASISITLTLSTMLLFACTVYKIVKFIMNVLSTMFAWIWPKQEELIFPEGRYDKSRINIMKEGKRQYRKCTKNGCGTRNVKNAKFCVQCGTSVASEQVTREGNFEHTPCHRVDSHLWNCRTVYKKGITSTVAALMLNSQIAVVAAHTVTDYEISTITLSRGEVSLTIYPEQFKILHRNNTHTATIVLTNRVLPCVRDITNMLPDHPVEAYSGMNVSRRRWDRETDTILEAEGMCISDTQGKVYHDENLNPFHISHGFVTDITYNRVGFCGAPYFCSDPKYKNTELIGIHVAEDSQNRAIVSCVSKEDLPYGFDKGLIIKHSNIEMEEDRVCSVPRGTIFYGYTKENYFVGNDTKYSVSPLHTDKGYVVETHFPLSELRAGDALHLSTRFHHNKHRPLHPEVQQYVEHNLIKLMKGFMKEGKLRTYTLREAICGNDFLKKLDMDTSIGPTLKKRGFTSRVELLDSNTGWIHDTLKEMVKARYKELATPGGATEYICTLALKDEPLPTRKTIKRVFYVYDLHDLIVFRMMFGDLMAAQLANHNTNGSTVGVNPHSVDWDILARCLTKHPNFLDSDYSKLDVTIAEYFFNWFWKYILYKYNLKEHSPTAQMMYRMLMMSASPLMLAGHAAFKAQSLNTSGWFLTLFINDFVVQCSHRIILEIFWLRAGYESMSWQQHVVLKSYGDDMIKSGSNTLMQTVDAEELALTMDDLFGLTLTNAAKTGAGEWKTNLSDMSFISRGFQLRNTFYMAPLCHSSFVKMLQWVQRSATASQHEVLQSIVTTAMFEVIPRGKQEFEDFMSRYGDVCRKLNIELRYEQYEVAYQQYLCNYLNILSVSEDFDCTPESLQSRGDVKNQS